MNDIDEAKVARWREHWTAQAAKPTDDEARMLRGMFDLGPERRRQAA